MAQFDFEKDGNLLTIDSKYYNKLDVAGFSRMMKDPSYCYKFYWLEAIVQLISEGVRETTFDDIIDEMICNAWYSVREYHIHLSGFRAGSPDGKASENPALAGIADGLERTILLLSMLEPDLASNASKDAIRKAIKQHNECLKDSKNQLTNMVPYRALAGFFPDKVTDQQWGSIRRITAYIEYVNKEKVLLPYTLGTESKLNKKVYFQPEWMEMIQDNTVSILGWIQYEKIKWLQSHNPEVPGLVYKLNAQSVSPILGKVRMLWDAFIENEPLYNVFSDEPIVAGKYDLDHYIPHSFVMCDELWNLMPMDHPLNLEKSNKLPEWDASFPKFAENQFRLYRKIRSNAHFYKMYTDCYKDNLHSVWAIQDLYGTDCSEEQFIGTLSKNMQPVYDSARRQGYEMWVRK